MSTVCDQAQDLNGQEFHRLTALFGCPEFVKSASVDEYCGDEQTEPHMFADVTRRRWPCHTAPATWASALFFFDKQAELSAPVAKLAEERILASAQFFNIDEIVDDLSKKIKQSSISDENELSDDAFAIIMKFDDGHKERKYPMRNSHEVKRAAEYINNYRDEFRFDDKNVIADKVLQKSAEFGVNLGELRDDIERMAGFGACSSKDAADLVRSRVNALGWPLDGKPLQVELEKLAQKLEDDSYSVHHHTTLTKLASTIDMVDRENNLVKSYGKSLERPEDIIFGVTKEAIASVSTELIGSDLTGTFFKRADLERLSVSELGDALGEDFADAVSTANAWVDTEKLAKILPTLPRNDMEIFEAVAAEAGVTPFATKSASARFINPANMQKMAAAHGSAEGSLWNRIK